MATPFRERTMSPDEVQRILRRAAELSATSPLTATAFTVGELERRLKELGIAASTGGPMAGGTGNFGIRLFFGFVEAFLDSRSPKRLVRAASGSKSPLTDSRPLRAAPRKSGNGLDPSLFRIYIE